MLTKEQNDLITLTGPGTPGGDMMRKYWHPVALTEELNADTPLPVRILSEDLVLFRDGKGQPHLIDRWCPHRRVDLSYGRVEASGIRCIYHGWLMSGEGRCLDQPGETANTSYKDRIRIRAYPCIEGGGIILTYMGDGEPPTPPKWPFMRPDQEPHVWASKLHHDCNYLQAHEGNVDPQHLSYLHRIFSAEESLHPEANDLYAGDVAPRIEIEETAFGLRLFAVRSVGSDNNYVRITNHIMPNCSAFAGVPFANPKTEPARHNVGYQVHWHVPIDDGSHWKYTIMYRLDKPLDKEYLRHTLFGDIDEHYQSNRVAENRYRQDRQELKRFSFAGVGKNFFDHDKLAVESQGRIMDRSQEHLGTTDRATILMRRQLLKAVDDVKNGRMPLFAATPNDTSDALADMVVRAEILPKTTEPSGDWWRTPSKEHAHHAI